MYSESGHMSVHIMRRDRGPTGGYTAYFGTYHVDAGEGFVIHNWFDELQRLVPTP